jgi:D-3-phosphoglycerate dehydrogenase
MPNVLIGPAPILDIEHAWAPALRGAGYDFVIAKRTPLLTEADLFEQLPGCVASLAGSEPYTPAVIAAGAAKGLRVIARAGVGYDAINVEAATAHGIPVCIGPGTNDNAVGEHAMMLLLALSRKLVYQNVHVRTGDWPRKAVDPVRGKTVGVIGLGRTGKAFARRAVAFDVKVVAYDPVVDSAFVAKYGIEMKSNPDDVFKAADYLSFHVPYTPLTHNYFNARTAALMKPTAYLINTSRGEVIHEPTLCQMLAEKKLAGAGLDVYVSEPVKAGNPLAAFENVLMTAHTAGIDTQSRVDMAAAAAKAILTLLKGEWLPDGWVVNPEVRERFLANRA